MAKQHRQDSQPSALLTSGVPGEVLVARCDVLWEVLAIQLKPTETETDALLAMLPPAPSSSSSSRASSTPSSLEAALQWTKPAPEDASVIVLQTLRDLGVLATLRIDIRELAKLIISIRKLYRLPEECPYHNWSHASAVAHYACILSYRLELSRRFTSPLPVFALIMAALCHDMDHRGQTNVFNVNQRTKIWHAYAYSCTHLNPTNYDNVQDHGRPATTNNGPLLEVHHLTLCDGLFKNCYPHILDNLSQNEVTQFYKLVEVIILATDLVAHPRVVQRVKQLKPSDLTTSAPFPLNPILSLFIGACDLNAAARDWLSSMKAARGIYLERMREEVLSSSSRTNIHNVGDDQCYFLERFVRPIFVEMTRLFPTSHPTLAAVDANMAQWKELGDRNKSIFTTDDLGLLIEKAEAEQKQTPSAASTPRKTSPRLLTKRTNAAAVSNKRPKQSVYR